MAADDYEVPKIACPRCGSTDVLIRENIDGTYEVELCHKCGYEKEKF